MKVLQSVLLPAAFAAALVFPSAAFAQQAAAPAPASTACAQEHEMHHGGPNRFAGLNLTPAQKAQIKQIREQYRAAHPCGSAPDPAAHRQMRQQIMNVLTPQQRQQLQSEMGQQHPGY